MDKGLTRLMKGRLRIAAVIMVCLLAIALPAMAFAATGNWSNQFPTGTITKSPNMVGAIWAGTGVRSRSWAMILSVVISSASA